MCNSKKFQDETSYYSEASVIEVGQLRQDSHLTTMGVLHVSFIGLKHGFGFSKGVQYHLVGS